MRVVEPRSRRQIAHSPKGAPNVSVDRRNSTACFVVTQKGPANAPPVRRLVPGWWRIHGPATTISNCSRLAPPPGTTAGTNANASRARRAHRSTL